ncbi:MAG: serine/threonine protein kinase [Deltaproteobacteria bacterium]|nr:serine/threonine protein kinase [Deltaproteobacteria bacterium]
MANDEKYQIIRKLDAGGMAEVYEGVAQGIQGFKKKIAIKRVLPHLVENEKFIAMFLDEARISLHLSHANIVQVFDIGKAGGTYFIVMEYVEGLNLKNILNYLKENKRVLPIEQSIFIAIEMCRGLSYAHSLRNNEGEKLNIVHRDVSPPNVLISKQGEVKIVDFGLAKANSQLEATAPGVVKGKYAYLCPQSATGTPVDLRMDVFGCGIVLYEMLTGKRLFLGKNDLETIENVRAANIPYLPEINSDVTPDLDSILRKALAKEPENRFQTCDALAESLAGYLFSHRLKVTSFDLQRFVQSILNNSDEKKKRTSFIDDFIKEELSVFTSIGRDNNWSESLLEEGAKSAIISHPEIVWSNRGENDSQPVNLEHMLEGNSGEIRTSFQQKDQDSNDFRKNFILGLMLAIGSIGIIFAAAWFLNLI